MMRRSAARFVLACIPLVGACSPVARDADVGSNTALVLTSGPTSGPTSDADRLRGFAHLERNAMLIGQGNRFELWDEQRWEERREQWLNGEESPTSLPAELGSLSL